MASIRKRNGKYQVQVRIGQSSKSKSFSLLTDAREWARSTELLFIKTQYLGKKYKPQNFSEILEKYKAEVTARKRSAINESIVVNALLRHEWVRKPLDQLSLPDLTAFRDMRLQTVKPATLKRQLNILKHACSVASEEWNWEAPTEIFGQLTLPKNPSHLVKRIRIDQEHLLYRELRKSRNPLMLPLVKLAILTGMRRGELLSLRNDDIDLASKLIYVRQSKNGKPRSIPLSQDIAEIIQPLINHDQCLVFPITGNAVRIAFANARKRASLNHIRFHDLRHEAISRLIEKGLTISEVAHLSGHRTLSSLSSYAHSNFLNILQKLGCGGETE